MALPGMNNNGDAEQLELAQLREQYRLSVRALQKMAYGTAERENQQTEIVEQFKKLEARGDKRFALLFRSAQETQTKFFGEFNKTTRGQIYAIATRSDKLVRNLQKVVKEDLVGTITGVDRDRKKEGHVTNTLVNRLLGAEKYARTPRSQLARVHDPVAEEHLTTIERHSIAHTELLRTISHNVQDLTTNLAKHFGWVQQSAQANQNETEANARANKNVGSDLGTRMGLSSGTGPKSSSPTGEGGAGLDRIVDTALGTAAGGLLKPVMDKALKALPIASLVGKIAGSLVGFAIDGVRGWLSSEDWGVDKVSGTLGGILGGANSSILNIFTNAGKWAIAGATIGSVVPVVGTLAGGLIGAAIGAVLGFIGGDKIAQWINAAGTTLGKWSDQILGTNFGFDEEATKKALTDARGEQDERRKKLTTTLQMIDKLQKDIEIERAAGNTGMVEAMQRHIDNLKASAARLSKESAEGEQKLSDLEKQASETRKSLREKAWDFTNRWFIEPLGRLHDALTGDNMMQNPERTKEESEKLRKQIVDINEATNKINEHIRTTTVALNLARKQGDESTVKALEDQLKILNERKDSLEKDKNSVQERLDQIAKDLSGASTKMFEGVRDVMTQSIKAAAEWMKKIFSWKYWLGDSEENPEKDDVRKKWTVSKMEGSTSHMFGAESKGVKDVIADFKSGKASDEDAQKRLEELAKSKKVSEASDANAALNALREYRNGKKEEPKIQPGETKPTEIPVAQGKVKGVTPPRPNLSEMNATEDATQEQKKANQASNQARVMQQITNNSTVNNSSAIFTTISPHNRERTFNEGIAGVRSTSYSGGR